MHKITVFILIIGVIGFVSCDKLLMKETRQEIDKVNLWGLLDTLHSEVNSANPLLIKKATLNGQTDTASLHLDSTQWKKEFENFSDLKLRPGRLLSQYNESIEEKESGILYSYFSKNYEKEALDSFVVEMDKEENVKFIQAFVNSENYFSSSSQILTLSLINVNEGKNLPGRYSIIGWQKIRTKDTIHFKVDAEIKY